MTRPVLDSIDEHYSLRDSTPDIWSLLSNCSNTDDDASSPTNPIWSEYLLDFHETAKSLTSTLYGELESIFSRIDINDIVPTSKPTDATPPAPSDSSYPAYIEPACQWLQSNLHNPYPSKEMRATLARKAGSDSKTIDSWFIDARKRIGWNSLRKKQFANKRLDIVDAATRFFVKEDAKRPLDSTVELEFAHILKSAKELYADRFEETKLATKLDIAIKDLTPTIKAQAREDRERRRREENALAATSYPSPQRSPSRSPEPHGLTPLEQDEDLATTHEAIAGQKRRSMSPGTEDEASDNRPTKRTRTGTSTTGLPSPSPSHKCLRRSTSPPPATDATPLPTISRKRRLSDADSQGVPKRPRGLAVGPRMHAVSDPLPMSSALIEASSIDGWFNAHFGIPTPVVVDALDESEQLDVQVFNYSIEHSDSPSSVSEALSSASNSPPSAQDVPSLVPDRFAPDTLEISTNTFHYDELFADYEEPEIVFSGSDLVNHMQNPSQIIQPPLLDFSLATFPDIPFTNHFDTTSFTTGVSQSQGLDTMTNSDFSWFVPPPFEHHDAFGSMDKLPDFGQTLVQDPSLVFVGTIPGMATLATGSIVTQQQVEDKAGMERRLAEMKEAMRSLEEKIAQSS